MSLDFRENQDEKNSDINEEASEKKNVGSSVGSDIQESTLKLWLLIFVVCYILQVRIFFLKTRDNDDVTRDVAFVVIKIEILFPDWIVGSGNSF